MGDFQEVAQGIADILNELSNLRETVEMELDDLDDLPSRHPVSTESISPKQLPEIATTVLSRRTGAINCYPGIPGYGCHDFAVFYALAGSRYVGKRRGHLTCEAAMQKIVQHMQGCCIGKTHNALFLTTEWNPSVAEKWRANLLEIGRHDQLEMYLLSGTRVSELFV